MMKLAYMINLPGYTPETYYGEYNTGESITRIVGTDNMEMAVEHAAKLAEEGFNLFNLCGDFDDEVTARISKAVGEGIKVRNAAYSPAELKKVEALEEFTRYGVIVVDPVVEEPVVLEVSSDDLYTKMWIVKDQDQAEVAAGKLSEEGMHDIELCSWFTEERTTPIIKAVNSDKIPVGSCGL